MQKYVLIKRKVFKVGSECTYVDIYQCYSITLCDIEQSTHLF